VYVLLRQPHGFEGLVLGAKVLPANDLPIPKLIEAAALDVRLYAAASRPHMDVAPGEHPLAKIGELEMQLEPFEGFECVGDEALEATARPRYAPSVAARRGRYSRSG
jgi:hypothetical protein